MWEQPVIYTNDLNHTRPWTKRRATRHRGGELPKTDDTHDVSLTQNAIYPCWWRQGEAAVICRVTMNSEQSQDEHHPEDMTISQLCPMQVTFTVV